MRYCAVPLTHAHALLTAGSDRSSWCFAERAERDAQAAGVDAGVRPLAGQDGRGQERAIKVPCLFTYAFTYAGCSCFCCASLCRMLLLEAQDLSKQVRS